MAEKNIPGLSREDVHIIVQCIHNARWMAENESAIKAINPRVMPAGSPARLRELLGKFWESDV